MKSQQELKIIVRSNYPAHQPRMFFMNDVPQPLTNLEYDQIWD
jgi:hypothetical protein